jgi:hypothetical protein
MSPGRTFEGAPGGISTFWFVAARSTLPNLASGVANRCLGSTIESLDSLNRGLHGWKCHFDGKGRVDSWSEP